jgi:hypothetical protein
VSTELSGLLPTIYPGNVGRRRASVDYKSVGSYELFEKLERAVEFTALDQSIGCMQVGSDSSVISHGLCCELEVSALMLLVGVFEIHLLDAAIELLQGVLRRSFRQHVLPFHDRNVAFNGKYRHIVGVLDHAFANM